MGEKKRQEREGEKSKGAFQRDAQIEKKNLHNSIGQQRVRMPWILS